MFTIASYITRQKIAKLVNIDTISFFEQIININNAASQTSSIFARKRTLLYIVYYLRLFLSWYFLFSYHLSINLIFIYYKLHFIIKSSSILLYPSLLQSRCIRVKFYLIIVCVCKPFKIKNFLIKQSIEVICI